MTYLLAGDIGATKTSLAVFSSEKGFRTPLAEATFHSSDYSGLDQVVREFLAQTSLTIDRASFGVPGPVRGGRVTLTNLPWVLDASHLQQVLGLRSVRILNDLEALADAVPVLEPADLHQLQRGQADAGGTIGVIAPGTALGEAFLTWDGSSYRAYPSEGGHTDFGPTDALERDLLRFLQEQFEHVSYERICSGIGLPNIYAYLKASRGGIEPPWLTEQFKAADDPTPIILNAALQGTSDLCVATLNTFVSILGAEAGNLALKVLATGGIYVGGGIPPRILSALATGRFIQAFQRKGRHANLLKRVPVHVITNPEAGLLGAARHGFED
jgi:glucokinase